jgi:hypothetical protein
MECMGTDVETDQSQFSYTDKGSSTATTSILEFLCINKGPPRDIIFKPAKHNMQIVLIATSLVLINRPAKLRE